MTIKKIISVAVGIGFLIVIPFATYAGPYGSCFVEGTLIDVPHNGQGVVKVPIENLHPGDKVVSYDEQTETNYLSTIERIENPIRDHYYVINGKLRVTGEHPLYIRRGEDYQGWAVLSLEQVHKDHLLHDSDLVLEEIALFDMIKTVDGWEEIYSIEYVALRIQTYNLVGLSPIGTYFADGYLAHNKGSSTIVPRSELIASEGDPRSLISLPFGLSVVEKSYSLAGYTKKIYYLGDHSRGTVDVYINPDLSNIHGYLKVYLLDEKGKAKVVGTYSPWQRVTYDSSKPIITYSLEEGRKYYLVVHNMDYRPIDYTVSFDFSMAGVLDSPCEYQDAIQGDKVYSAQWVSQTQGDGMPDSTDGVRPIVMKPGQTKTIQVSFKNVGTATWYNIGNDMVAFYVYRDPFYSTPLHLNTLGRDLFESDSWGPSFDGKNPRARSATMDQCAVQPGGIANFFITLYVPLGTKASESADLPSTLYNDYYYRSDFSMAHDSRWMSNTVNGDPLNIAHVWIPIRVE